MGITPYINVWQAGIPREQLILAFEPEVAAIFCKEMKLKLSNSGDLEGFYNGARVIVIDLGGNVVPIVLFTNDY